MTWMEVCLRDVRNSLRVIHEPDRFVEVASRSSSFGEVSRMTSLRDYRAYRDGAHSFVELAAWTTVHATLTSAAAGFRAVPLLVTCNFFAVYECLRH